MQIRRAFHRIQPQVFQNVTRAGILDGRSAVFYDRGIFDVGKTFQGVQHLFGNSVPVVTGFCGRYVYTVIAGQSDISRI